MPALNFPQHQAALRKERGLIQQALAKRVGRPISQIRRDAMALRVTADMLLLEKDESGWRRIATFFLGL